MKKDTNTSGENTHSEGTSEKRFDYLFLLIGIILIVMNVLFFSSMKLDAILFQLNMHYWSFYFSAILWIAAIWAAAESIESLEDYLLAVRIVVVVILLLLLVFASWDYFGSSNSTPQDSSPWFHLVIVVVLCCIVRSLFLLYEYWQGGKDTVDIEEARWFWGLSGFIIVICVVLGTMYIMTVKTPGIGGVESLTVKTPLLITYVHGLQEMFRSGQGTFALRAFGIISLITFVALIYVAGKWGLIFIERTRGE